MSANANCFSRVFVYIQMKWFMCESSHRSMVRNWRRRWKNGRNCNKLSLRSHYNELTILQSILIAFESRTEPSAIRIALTAHDLFGMWLSAREYLLNSSNTVLIRVACSKHSLSLSLSSYLSESIYGMFSLWFDFNFINVRHCISNDISHSCTHSGSVRSRQLFKSYFIVN